MFLCFVCLCLWADNRIEIPLQVSTISLMHAPMDNPTGSTPDPTDPNQFRASLTGNTLFIETQEETVSFVVIQSDFKNETGEDYFFALSTDSVSCTIDRPGKYIIRIGHWNTDFVGSIEVKSMDWFDYNGKDYGPVKPVFLPGIYYIFCLQTNIGNSTVKYQMVQ